MGLISKTVMVKWHSTNKKHYESLGYTYTRMGDEFEAKIEDLTKGSNVKVDCKCDGCGKDLIWTYNDYNSVVRGDGRTYCQVCGNNLAQKGEAFSKSFYDWCIENDRSDVLNRWDYDLNNCSPKDITCSTNKKYYFKCNTHKEHDSELKNIASFTSGCEGSITCNQCNSFYQWCIDNNRQDVIIRWDYELNNCSPKNISYSTNKKYYFKCNMHTEHSSELKQISSFTSGCEGSIACKQCNSIAQYILDNFPDRDIYDVWDKEKNGDVNPWGVSKGNRSKYWFICQEKEYHGSYEATCSAFINNSRCPYCASQKTHPKDSLGQYIIDNYGEEFLLGVWSNKNNISPFELLPNSSKKVWWKCFNEKHNDYLRSCAKSFRFDFRCPKCSEEINNSTIEEKTKKYLQELGYDVLTEHNCTLRPINPKTKRYLPYDNEIILPNSKHLIIEVHGSQHYKTSFYKSINKCLDEEAEEKLKQRKLYDRYKKAYAEHYNYYYLELPYTSFEGKNKDQYKQMIDNKIKEILEKEEIA